MYKQSNALSAILFVPHYNSSFNEMLPLAIKMKERNLFRPIFLIHWKDKGLVVQKCQLHKIDYVLLGESSNVRKDYKEQSPYSGSLSSIFRKRYFRLGFKFFKDILKKVSLVVFFKYLFRFWRIKNRGKLLLDELQPVCILLMGDRHIGVETALVSLANKRCIPSLIVPFAFSEPSGTAILRRRRPDGDILYGMEKFFNRLIAYLRPAWTYDYDGKTLLWKPAEQLLAAALLRMMPANPWALGGGQAWYMAVESDLMRQRFELQGIPTDKLIVTGKPLYDAAARLWKHPYGMRSQICELLDVNVGRPLIVCSVPQLAEHELLSWDEHWYEMDFLFSALADASLDATVVLSLHPKSDPAKYEPLAYKYNLFIAEQYTFDQLIPVCDLLVATYSSTVTLAIACHKPVVVVDFYGLNHNIFDEVPGVKVLKDRQLLSPTLQRLLTDQTLYQELVAHQVETAKSWACFDGQAIDRIMDLVDGLIDKAMSLEDETAFVRRRSLPDWVY